MATDRVEGIEVDLCPRCRRAVDWAIDSVPVGRVYIKANLEEPGPRGKDVVIDLCETCGRFVNSVLKVDGFTLHT